ncbi:MAG: hypothetical protein MZV63_50775 [Marinilabiliales bacterium]|nr:hypothetical protein [Marinilabiliales bacterium]
MINHAERPLILAGHGILLSGAENELKAFAEKTGIPVALTLLGLSAFPSWSQTLCRDALECMATMRPNLLTNQADLIIAMGMRFDDRVTGNLKKYATRCKDNTYRD